MPALTICLSLYRRLASAYPHEFRILYGEDLDRLGEDAIPEVWRTYGLKGLLRLLVDIAVQLPATYLVEIRQDIVYALRVLAKSPGFTAVAVLSLAVGIGMCCAVMSEVQSVLGPPPGVRDPAALVALKNPVSYPYFEHYRHQHQAAAGATALLGPVPFAVAFTAGKSVRSERFYGHLVSPEYFSTLGVMAAAGRVFAPETEKPGMPPIVVISDRFWRTHMAANPQAVGSRLRLNGWMATIVGIAPKDFLGIWPANPADLFVPVTCAGSLAPELHGDPLQRRDRDIFRVVLRLAPGVTIGSAEAALDTLTRNLDQDNLGRLVRDPKGKAVELWPAGTRMYVWPGQRTFMNTFNIVLWALVLSLACANLANLLLARSSQRRREVAIRLAVGASRPRLIRQLLTESVILSVAGGLAGIVLAYWITHMIASLPMPSPTPLEFNCEPDLPVLAVTLAIALAAGIGFGLAPAFASTSANIGMNLKENAQETLRRYRRFGVRNLFVMFQMAASLMLLLVTWYVALGFLHTARLDPGFEISNLNLVSIDPVRDGYSIDEAAALFARLPDELSRVSSVRAVSLTGSVPFASLAADQANTRMSASDGQLGKVQRSVFRDRIGANYFATLGAPVINGRDFDRRDQQRTDVLPAILNQTGARELFGAENPISRRIREGELNYTVVGVTRDVQSGLFKPTPVATVFLPLTADEFRKNPAQRLTILVRGIAGQDTLASVRSQMASLHPNLTVFDSRSLREDLARLNAFIEWDSAIYVTLGLFALLLACIGLGGVTAYAVARRRKEIGIRMALGARGGQVQRLVLREGTALVLAGSVLGFGGAFVLLRAFTALSEVLARTFALRVDDPFLVVGAPFVLATIAMLACYLPARRATHIDPMSVLREE